MNYSLILPNAFARITQTRNQNRQNLASTPSCISTNPHPNPQNNHAVRDTELLYNFESLDVGLRTAALGQPVPQEESAGDKATVREAATGGELI